MAKNSLQLSYRNRKIAGVCGGLGEYFGLDPVIVRIAFVIFLLTGGAGILLYFICWMIMPER
jgi:phage shock protein C